MGAAPTTPEERTSLAKGIAGAMQVIRGEDFDQCVRMQRNFFPFTRSHEFVLPMHGLLSFTYFNFAASDARWHRCFKPRCARAARAGC